MSKHKTIKVISVPAGKQAFIKEISTGLESLQAEVGGYIQAICPFEDEVALICNDEAKLTGLPLNRALKLNGMAGNENYDIIAGDFFICYSPYTSENFESMPEDLLQKYLEVFRYPEHFLIKNQTIYIYPER